MLGSVKESVGSRWKRWLEQRTAGMKEDGNGMEESTEMRWVEEGVRQGGEMEGGEVREGGERLPK